MVGEELSKVEAGSILFTLNVHFWTMKKMERYTVDELYIRKSKFDLSVLTDPLMRWNIKFRFEERSLSKYFSRYITKYPAYLGYVNLRHSDGNEVFICGIIRY